MSSLINVQPARFSLRVFSLPLRPLRLRFSHSAIIVFPSLFLFLLLPSRSGRFAVKLILIPVNFDYFKATLNQNEVTSFAALAIERGNNKTGEQ